MSTQGEGFTPRNIGDLKGWWDATEQGNFTLNEGVSVIEWLDKSGNDFTASISNAARRPNLTSFDNVRGVFFDNSQTHNLNVFQSGFCATGAGNNTVLILAAPISAAATDLRMFGGRGSLTAATSTHTWRYQAIPVSSGFAIFQRNNTAQIANRVSSATPIVSVWGLYVGVFNGTSTRGYYNGLYGSEASASPATVVSCQIGAAGSDTPSFNGYINQVVVYSSALTSSQINQVANYLAAKANITWTNV